MDSALRILERSGYIHYEDNPDGKARLMFCLNRNDLYLLDNLSPKEEAIVTALLRTYGGLFTDFVYIDESLIAHQADTSTEQVYVVLKNFAARHIVKFVPRRKTPYITYTRDRIDGEKVLIPQEVWEQRREQYIRRIEGILHYAQEDYICHQQQNKKTGIRESQAGHMPAAWRPQTALHHRTAQHPASFRVRG